MNAYRKRGLSWGDCLDYARTSGQLGLSGRLALVDRHLLTAVALRRRHARELAQGLRILHDVTPLQSAYGCVHSARQWRLELRGAS